MRTLLLVVTLCLFAGELALGIAQSVPTGARPVPLVDRSDWTIDGEFVELQTSFPPAQVPATMTSDPRFIVWRSWTPAKGATKGTVMTKPFATPMYIAVPYQGFAGDAADLRLFLRCEETRREIEVAAARTPTEWSTVYLRLGNAFCNGDSRLIAVSNGQAYIGVGTPFEVSADQYFVHTNVAPRVLVALLAVVLLSCHLFVGDLIGRRFAPGSSPLPSGFAFVGCVGMAEIALFVAVPAAARWASGLAVLAIVLAVPIAAWRDPVGSGRWLACVWRPLSLWTSVAIAYVALISSGDSGAGQWAVNGFFTPLRWSSDNQFPMQIAEDFYERVAPGQILFPPWNGFDRTPLLSGLMLPFRVALLEPFAQLFGRTMLPMGYLVVAIVLLSTWVLVLTEACRALRVHRAAPFVVCLAAVTPFFVFNTVYAWPKMIGGGFAVLAFCALLRAKEDARQARSACVLAAIFAGCSYLLHASNVLVLAVTAVFFAPTLVRQRWRTLVVASSAVIALVGGWSLFAESTQPHSNALLRYALANDFGLGDRTASIWTSMLTAYRNLGWEGWLDLKNKEAIRLFVPLHYDPEMARYAPHAGWSGELRIVDFTSVGRAIGPAFIGALVLLVARDRVRGGAGTAGRSTVAAAGVALATMLLSVVVFLPEATPHQLPYGATMLLFLAGAVTIDRAGRRIRIIVMTFAALYCLRVWVVDPVGSALRQDVAAEAVLAQTAFVMMLLACSRWPQRRSIVARTTARFTTSIRDGEPARWPAPAARPGSAR